MGWGSLALILQPGKVTELRPLSEPNGVELGQGYDGSLGAMIDAIENGGPSPEVVTFDLVFEENHESEADITLHPIEGGVEITDHIRWTRDGLSLRGMITDTPVQNIVEAVLTGGFDLGSITTLTGDAPPSVDAWLKLKQMQRDATVFNVVTGLEIARNMAIKRLGTSRTNDNSGALFVDLEFQQVNVIDTSGATEDGTEAETDLGALGAFMEIDPVMLLQAATFLALLTWAYVEAYTG